MLIFLLFQNSCFFPFLPLLTKKQDFILAELLRQQQDWIVKYHEHDSLLENVVDESLTEEERKVAWSEYEAEKEGRMLQMANPDFNVMPGMVRHDRTNLKIIDDQNKCVSWSGNIHYQLSITKNHKNYQSNCLCFLFSVTSYTR